ncbi:thimet oligopeptidase-like [Centruroides sculpturatus]|uniref:thimet oligopeptidase-like n=1 Tax=Centruroides sculpturatus TaxID=218467 RepID=UPI000C6DBCA5|nr:thimet oligopeptidase-like [Centruroides sculpturatus]
MTPQGIKFCYDLKLSAEELLKRTDDLIDRLRKTYDKVGALSNDQVSCKTVLEPLNYAEAEKQTEGALYELPKHVSTDKALRDAGSEADRKLREFHIEIGMRQDIFNKLLLLEAKNETLDSEYSRYLQKLIKLGKRNGLHLSPTVQAKIKSLKTEISNYCVEFIKNVNEENTILEFSEEELDGLPADFIENLTKSETGKRKVTLKYPHYFSIMGKAKNPETRKKLEYAFNSRCIDENSTILEKLAELRHETALLLGFPNHVAFITDLRMAKTAKTVYNFLTTLASKLEPLWKEERKFIMELKNKECNKLDIPFEDKLHPSELRYYNNLVEEIKYSVDQNKLREYFPLPTVTKGLLNIYQELLGLEFAEIKNPVAWHPDVQLYFVSGANVEWDFVEAPSQMLENWCWEPETLRRMSGHYKDGSPLPDNILQSLVHSRLANVGYFNLRQVALSMLDYNIHTNPKADTRQIYHDLSCSLLGIPPTEGTNFAANFGHLVDGYDAGYYSYLWSEVYSMDMFFSRFKSEGIMNYQTGKDYRNKILAPGGTKDGFDMLRDFLGREPNDEAFLKNT